MLSLCVYSNLYGSIPLDDLQFGQQIFQWNLEYLNWTDTCSEKIAPTAVGTSTECLAGWAETSLNQFGLGILDLSVDNKDK